MHQNDINTVENETGKTVVEINPPVSDDGLTWSKIRLAGEAGYRIWWHFKRKLSEERANYKFPSYLAG